MNMIQTQCNDKKAKSRAFVVCSHLLINCTTGILRLFLSRCFSEVHRRLKGCILCSISVALIDCSPQNGESLHSQTRKKFSSSVKMYLHIYSVYSFTNHNKTKNIFLKLKLSQILTKIMSLYLELHERGKKFTHGSTSPSFP